MNPDARIRNPDIMNDERNNSLQQCLINKYGENYFVVIFLALLQPQTAIALRNYLLLLNNP